MDKQKDRIRQYYDSCDWDYQVIWRDNKSLGMHFGFYYPKTKSHTESLLNENVALAKLAGIHKDDVVLDAGCGVGGTAIWLAKNFQIKVYGITLTENQVDQAKKNAKKHAVEDLCSFSLQDYHSTKFPNEYFTVIWAQESLPHSPDKKKFLKEAFRLLKPGGRLVTADYFLGQKFLNSKENNVFSAWLDGWAMTNLTHSNQFTNLLEEIGFRNVKFKNTSQLIEPSLRRLKRFYYIGSPIHKILEFMHIRNSVHAGDVRGAYYGWKTFKMGLWKHGLVYAEKP